MGVGALWWRSGRARKLWIPFASSPLTQPARARPSSAASPFFLALACPRKKPSRVPVFTRLFLLCGSAHRNLFPLALNSKLSGLRAAETPSTNAAPSNSYAPFKILMILNVHSAKLFAGRSLLRHPHVLLSILF